MVQGTVCSANLGRSSSLWLLAVSAIVFARDNVMRRTRLGIIQEVADQRI